MRSMRIRSAQGAYDAVFVDTPTELVAELPTGGALLLVDRQVAKLHANALAAPMSRLPVLEIDATEDEKTLQGVERVVSWMQSQNATRQTVLVAVGGGIIQDIATFAAHVYYRGVRWFLVPSTLLSMADSCIGAKASINLNAFKNQLGVFHAPARVVIWSGFVDTLTDEAVASGYGEILKLMYTGSSEHWAIFRREVESAGFRGPHLAELIATSLEVKRRVIEEDEYDEGLRQTLNYGHTFGHALEALTDHAVPHGQAVAWGIDLVNYIAWQGGLLPENEFREVHDVIRRYFSRSVERWPEAAMLIDATRRDKKVTDGQLKLVLARGPGQLSVVKRSFDASLHRLVSTYLAQWNVFA